MKLNAQAARVPLPRHMADLPISERGFPIPYFVWIDPNGNPDFRVIRPGAVARCIRFNRCWICGQPLGRNKCFVIGPMCMVNRLSAEPPSHFGCASYATQVCPFLTNPRARRNDAERIEGVYDSPMHIRQNPGGVILWTCHQYETFRQGGMEMFTVGDPSDFLILTEGRRATEDEARVLINTGIARLHSVASAEGPQAVAELKRAVLELCQLLPFKLEEGSHATGVQP